MLRISGPVSVSIFHLQDDKKIILFGDAHESKTGLCKQVKKSNIDNIFITDFIDSFQSSPTDVFLESDWVPDVDKEKVAVQQDVDILRVVLNHYNENMYKTQNKKQGLRVHYTDIRCLQSFLELCLSIQAILYSVIDQYIKIYDKHPIEVILRCFPTLKTFNEFTDIILKSDNYKQDMNKLVKDDNIFTGSNVLASAPGHTKRKIHRIRKQLLKLSLSDRTKLLSYHQETISHFHKTFKNRYNNKIKNLKNNGVEKTHEDDIIEIAYILMLYTSHIMDIYALARIIYYIRNTNSKTIISYAGAVHSLNYTKFFVEFWQKEAKLVLYQDVKQYKNRSHKRCVSIPKVLL